MRGGTGTRASLQRTCRRPEGVWSVTVARLIDRSTARATKAALALPYPTTRMGPG